jgi:hypothetical protein
MTSRFFNTILIGSGPCALAALTVVAREQNLAVVTGAVPEPHRGQDIHPKIRVVALEGKESPGLAERLDTAQKAAKPMFSTAALGGLANYWGQQLVRYSDGDPYSTSIFKNYETYLADCTAIEGNFSITEGSALSRPTDLPDEYFVSRPRLLTGTAAKHEAGLMSIRLVIESLLSGADIFPLRAQRIFRKDQFSWSVQLSNGKLISGRKILLAAGVVGTARIVLSSLPDVIGMSFCDHSPHMAYASGLGELIRTSSSQHFNALTVEKWEAGRCAMFASIYNMSAAELNLILASTIGRIFPLLRGVSAPPFAAMLQPVQIWTDGTYSRLDVDPASGRFSGSHFTVTRDDALEEMLDKLQRIGARIWHCSRTPPGRGFHYHALNVRRKNEKEQSLAEALAQWSAGAVSCIDASILPKIGLRPHTLTAMAAARRLVSRESRVDMAAEFAFAR